MIKAIYTYYISNTYDKGGGGGGVRKKIAEGMLGRGGYRKLKKHIFSSPLPIFSIQVFTYQHHKFLVFGCKTTEKTMIRPDLGNLSMS